MILTFDLGTHGACRRYGCSISISKPSQKFVGINIRKIDTLPVSVLVDLVTLTFDLYLETGTHYRPYSYQFVFLNRIVLDLSDNTCIM